MQNHYISWNKEFNITTKHKFHRHTFLNVYSLENHKRLQHVPHDAGYCNQLESMVEKENSINQEYSPSNQATISQLNNNDVITEDHSMWSYVIHKPASI